MYINVINLSHFGKKLEFTMNDHVVWQRYINLTNGMRLSSTRRMKIFDQTFTWKVMDDDN